MRVSELSDDEKYELKRRQLIERCEGTGEFPSWNELACAHLLVTDRELEDIYGDTEFTKDDFFCNSETVTEA
jgi:hypothetical protein